MDNVDIKSVQQIIRHAEPKTTLLYYCGINKTVTKQKFLEAMSKGIVFSYLFFKKILSQFGYSVLIILKTKP